MVRYGKTVPYRIYTVTVFYGSCNIPAKIGIKMAIKWPKMLQRSWHLNKTCIFLKNFGKVAKNADFGLKTAIYHLARFPRREFVPFFRQKMYQHLFDFWYFEFWTFYEALNSRPHFHTLTLYIRKIGPKSRDFTVWDFGYGTVRFSVDLKITVRYSSTVFYSFYGFLRFTVFYCKL